MHILRKKKPPAKKAKQKCYCDLNLPDASDYLNIYCKRCLYFYNYDFEKPKV